MKNRLTTFTVLLLLSFSASAQYSQQSVINSSGGSFHHGYYRFEWSVGEMALVNQMTDAGGTFVVTNGFLQPYILYPGQNNEETRFDADEVRIFPNPATEYIEINFTTKQKGKITVQCYDASGKSMITEEYTSNGVDLIERIPITQLSQGLYFVHIVLTASEGYISKKSTYKIIKTQ
jgi:hypothetical protein